MATVILKGGGDVAQLHLTSEPVRLVLNEPTEVDDAYVATLTNRALTAPYVITVYESPKPVAPPAAKPAVAAAPVRVAPAAKAKE